MNNGNTWPAHTAHVHGGGQQVIFAIAEPSARAAWWKAGYGNPYDGAHGLLADLCQNSDTASIGLGMALVINNNGCPQLILGKRAVHGSQESWMDNHDTCISVPEASTLQGGCPSILSTDYGTFAECAEWSYHPTTGEQMHPCLRRTDHLQSSFNFRPVQAWVDSLETEPNKPHQIQVVFNELNKRDMASQYAERATHPRPQDTFTPAWSIYIDGEVFASSTYINPVTLERFPTADQPPHDSTNGHLSYVSFMGFNAAQHLLPAEAPVLSDIITPTMRLYVGTDGLEYNHWWVDDPSGEPADIAVHAEYLSPAPDYKVYQRRQNNPVMNSHPFSGNVEFVALHKTAFTPQQVRSQWASGIPNRPPRIPSSLTALSVYEDDCGVLQLPSTDDDVTRFGKVQPVQWNVISTANPVYSDAACTQQVLPSETNLNPSLYYKSPSNNFVGPFGSMVVRAHDGIDFSRTRTITLSIDPVVDGPVINDATVEMEPLSAVGIVFSGTSADTGGDAEVGFRIKIVSLPATGRLYSGDFSQGALVSGPPLSIGDITTSSTVYYESLSSVTTASRIAQTESFQVRGVAPPGQNDAESPHVANVTVNVLSALRPVTTAVVGVEDSTFLVKLRTFYAGSRSDLTFQLVAQTDVTLFQSDGAPVTSSSVDSPVVLDGPVIDCEDDANYKCTYLGAKPAANIIGRRLSVTSSATFSYQVVANGVTSNPVPVAISISNILDPLSEFVCTPLFNFSRAALTVVYPLADGGINITDTDGGAGGAGWAYVQISTSSFTFDVTLAGSPGADFVQTPSVTSYQTYPQKAYDMVGYCPAVCTTTATSLQSATNGYECSGCLTRSDVVRGVNSFRAVMAPNMIMDTLRSIRIAISEQGYVANWDDQMFVQVIKFDNTSRSGYETNCTIELSAAEEPFFEVYGLEGQCFFHSSIDLFTRIIQLAGCVWFDWNGTVFWWFRGNGLANGYIYRFLFYVWWFLFLGVLFLCCACACFCAGQSFVRYVLTTLRMQRAFLERDEIKRRGPRLEAGFVQTVLLYGTCYGFFCCCPSLCLPGRENDKPLFQKLRYWLWAYVTCKIFPQLRPDDEPVGPTWSEWLWGLFSWVFCYGCSVIPSMAKRKNRDPESDPTSSLLSKLPPASVPLKTSGILPTRRSTDRVDRVERPVLSLKLDSI